MVSLQVLHPQYKAKYQLSTVGCECECDCLYVSHCAGLPWSGNFPATFTARLQHVFSAHCNRKYPLSLSLVSSSFSFLYFFTRCWCGTVVELKKEAGHFSYCQLHSLIDSLTVLRVFFVADTCRWHCGCWWCWWRWWSVCPGSSWQPTFHTKSLPGLLQVCLPQQKCLIIMLVQVLRSLQSHSCLDI